MCNHYEEQERPLALCPKCESAKDVEETIPGEFICTYCDELFSSNQTEWNRLNAYWRKKQYGE